MRVSVIGSGYVGLVSGVCLADAGHQVTCVDVDPARVDAINAGRPTIHERGLPGLLARNAGSRLRATTDLPQAVAESELTFIAVGTPARDGRIDLGQVEAAAREVGCALRNKRAYHVVAVKSTVVPGTTDGLVRETLEAVSGLCAGPDFGLSMNPEFLTEGQAVDDFTNPDRIVIGGIDSRTQEIVERAYAAFKDAPRIITNNTTAEFIKYASNAVLATMISFANEMSRLCAAVGGVDVVDVLRGVHAAGYFTSRLPGHEPVAAGITSYLEAGCGFGGSCLPKDVTALIGRGRELGLELPLLRSVLAVNDSQPEELMKLIAAHHGEVARTPVTVLGLAFKPDTDDVRESPAFPLLRSLKKAGAVITVYDPVVGSDDHEELKDVRFAPTLEAAVARAEVIMLVTRWQEFQRLPELLSTAGRAPLVVDGRRVLRAGDFSRYAGIGRAGSSA